MIRRKGVVAFLLLFVFMCPCSGDFLDRFRDCHKIRANETCPDDYCTYYFRDPGPFLTCCVCEHYRVVTTFYFSLVLFAILLLLVHEFCCSFAIVCVILSMFNVFSLCRKCRSEQPSDEDEKLINIEV